MAYNELIKNFNKVRDYMRDFYIYGFKSREAYTRKSTRSYDDEKRRIESWLGEYMKFRQDADGKKVFLSIDSRVTRHNPLYKAWKTKSFTDGDITLHFILMDILSDGQERSLMDIASLVDGYLTAFEQARVFDAATIRNKLNALLFEKGNVHELAACVSRILTDKQLAKELSASERETAAKLYNGENNYQKLIEIYQSIE